MPTIGHRAINILLTIVVLIAMIVTQTTIWYQIFHPLPPPNLWLPVIVYFSLYRPFNLGIISIYFSALFIASSTSEPLHLLILTVVSCYFSIQLFRLKFFWSGAGYFMMVCSFAVGMLHLLTWIFSLNLETNFLTSPRWSAWIVELTLTPVVAPIIFALLKKIDAVTNFQAPNEYGFESL